MGGNARTQIAARPMWGRAPHLLRGISSQIATLDSVLEVRVKPMPLHAEAIGSPRAVADAV